MSEQELRGPEYLYDGETYGSFEEFKHKILYKKISKWKGDKLVLDDGTVLEIVCSEQDCCAEVYGSFTNVELDAVITDVLPPSVKRVSTEGDLDDFRDGYNLATLKIFHNQNVIAQANIEADAGRGGYYYSVGSIQIGKVHYEMVSA